MYRCAQAVIAADVFLARDISFPLFAILIFIGNFVSLKKREIIFELILPQCLKKVPLVVANIQNMQ